VSIDGVTGSVIAAHRARQDEERLALGDLEHGPALRAARRSTAQPQNISQAFGNVVRRLGLPRIRLHDLRHTSPPSLSAPASTPKVVSERLGHSSIAITLDTYSHVVPGLQEAAASTLASLVLGTRLTRAAGEIGEWHHDPPPEPKRRQLTTSSALVCLGSGDAQDRGCLLDRDRLPVMLRAVTSMPSLGALGKRKHHAPVVIVVFASRGRRVPSAS
jgi:hypothetical protein